MTNGEKLQSIFPNIIKYGNILINDTGALQKNILFDDSWWNAEYKEPTTKNNLAVDKEQLKTMIRGLTKWYVKRDNIEVGAPNTAVGLLYDDVMFGIDRLPSVTPQEPRWIPISERLPEDGKWNIFTDGKNISVERYKADAIDHFYPQGRWFSLDEVLAWMPLPEPYKAENKGDKE